MDLPDLALLFASGLVAGVANTIAGGGSLVAVPMLIHLGIEPRIANATSRPAIVFQNLSGILGFKRAGVFEKREVWRHALVNTAAALPGALAGAWFASAKVDNETFERLLALVLIGVLVYTWIRRFSRRKQPDARVDRPWLSTLGFVFLGFYGGFIQAGIGFLIVALLMNATRFSLAEINAQKLLTVLLFTPVAIVVFASHGMIRWFPAAILIVAQSIGGYLGSLLSVIVAEEVLLKVYSLLLVVFAISLLR